MSPEKPKLKKPHQSPNYILLLIKSQFIIEIKNTKETGLSYSYVSIIVSDFCWPKENIYAKKKLY